MWKQAAARPLLATGVMAASVAAAAVAIRCCTYVHPYLVNDESHRFELQQLNAPSALRQSCRSLCVDWQMIDG